MDNKPFRYETTEVVHSRTTKKGTKKWKVPVKHRPFINRSKSYDTTSPYNFKGELRR